MLISFLILFYNLSSQAQIVNRGLIYLSPDSKISALYSFDNQDDAEFFNDGQIFIYKNFNNNGIFDFYENSGKVIFKGQQLQLLNGQNPGHFYEVVFDNPSQLIPFHLKGEFHIHHSAVFKQGIVDNRNFGGRLIFENQALALQASDLSHVQGPVEKRGGEDFIFPVGDETFYRHTGISNLNTGHYQAEYFYGNSNNFYPHQQKESVINSINNREYWLIKSLENTGEQIFISLSFHNMATPQEFINAAIQNTLAIVRWDEENFSWVNEGGTIHLNNQIIMTTVDELGIFSLGKIDKESSERSCEPEVFNFIDLNSFSDNKYMRIHSDCAEDLSVSVFNRWGIKVFETDNYGVQGAVFDGYSGGRLTINKKEGLPAGTYYYILNYKYNQNGQTKSTQKVGFVYLRTN